MSASLSFLAWARQGAASAIKVDDSPTAPAVATVAAKLTLNGAALPDVPIRLRGPADVTGIDPNQVIRTDPKPGAIDFESNCFASIEFDRPDFPWLFTPARANGLRHLRPWLALVVVARQPGVSVETPPGAPLPVLHVTGPAKPGVELPDLTDSWAWAHAQVAAADSRAANVGPALSGAPELSLSRLVCPRMLDPKTDYIACVVPAFDLGRRTGLGLPVTDADLQAADALKPAWLSGASAPSDISLPVYYRWEFHTGDGGDFESIAIGLQPGAPTGLGRRPIDISRPGFDAAGATTLALEGALTPIPPSNTDAPPPAAFQTNLAAILNAPGKAETTTGADPVLAPPIYGRWHAADATVAAPAGSAWLDQLNLDPRWRVAAAFGTQVVQTHQEALMASAWDQAADLQLANQRLRQLQMSRAVGESLHERHFAPLDDEAMMRVAAPAFGRTGLRQGKSMLAVQAASPLPMGANGSAMRRIGRVRGPLSRRVAMQQKRRADTPTWVARLMTPQGPPTPPQGPPPPDFSVWPAVPGGHFLEGDSYWGAFFVTPETQALPYMGEPWLVANLPGQTERPGHFRYAARRHLAGFFPARPPQPAVAPPADLSGARDQVLKDLEPKTTLGALAATLVATGDNVLKPTAAHVAADGLETVMAAPRFPAPMYQPLRDLSQNLLIPGLDTVQSETAVGLGTNRRFVESYMVGLNHEMGRELLWRGFPTDQRGTYFSHFWGVGDAPAAADIDDLAGWGQRALGASAANHDEKFVLLLRSRLLARYPNAVIYMTPAQGTAAAMTPAHDVPLEVPPIFTGDLKPDLVFFGFPVTPDAALNGGTAGLGYYVVIQEHPTEPRFGIDFGSGPAGQSHLVVGGALPKGKAAWAADAGHMAGLFRRRPARVAIHARRLIAHA